MNRRKVIIGLLFLLIGALFIVSNLRRFTSTSNTSCKTHHDAYQVINSPASRGTGKFPRLRDEQFSSLKLLVADSPAKWEYGLMNVKSKKDICGNDGMIFTFPIAMPQTFWNKDTLVDLDIYWMKGEKIVGQDRLPAIIKSGLTTVSSPDAVDRVVEIIR